MIDSDKIETVCAKNKEYKSGYIEGVFDCLETFNALYKDDALETYEDLIEEFKKTLINALEAID